MKTKVMVITYEKKTSKTKYIVEPALEYRPPLNISRIFFFFSEKKIKAAASTQENTLSGPVNNPSASVNNSILLSLVMEVQSEFMDTNVLKQYLNKVWFDLKETYAYSESNCFDFKIFQKENITFNENT